MLKISFVTTGTCNYLEALITNSLRKGSFCIYNFTRDLHK